VSVEEETGLSRRELFQRYGLGAIGLGFVADFEDREAAPGQLHEWEPKKAQAGGSIRSSHLLFISSIGGWYPDWRPEPGDVREQMHDALTALKERLENAGTTMDNVLKVQVALVDPEANWEGMNEVYGQFFSAPRPVRSFFGTTGFRIPGQLLHIDCVAYID
jgi:2-iminobutanoate/2-iminopropanoate deaminase